MKKLVFVSLAAVMASFAASADTVVTSKTYVDTKMQSKMATGAADSIPVYTGTLSDTNAPTFSPRAIHSVNTYDGDTDANKIPTMGAVMAQITGHEVQLPTGTEGSVVLYGTGGALGGDERAIATTLGTNASATTLPTTGAVVTGFNQKFPANNATTYPNGSLVAYGTTAGTPSTKKIVTTIAANGTDIPTDGAVYSAVDAVQQQVTQLAACKHTCTSSDPTNSPNACDLITIDCVES